MPQDRIAKAVILKEDESYLMVVVPADHYVHLGRMHRHLGHEVGLATEAELTTLFPDCDAGAIPPLGAAYGLRTLVDDSLTTQSDIFFESGDHLHMAKVSGNQSSRCSAKPRTCTLANTYRLSASALKKKWSILKRTGLPLSKRLDHQVQRQPW